MPTTPVYGLPWPLSTATPDVPRDMQALAEGTEAAVLMATVGHARGSFPSQSIPNNTSTNPSNIVASLEVVTHSAGVFTLAAAGYWAVSFNFGFASPPSRSALTILAPDESGSGQTQYRYAFTSPESLGAASTTVYSDSTGQVSFRVFQDSGGALTGNGIFTISYLGA